MTEVYIIYSMLKIKGKINLILLVFNIFCLLYYSIQLLAFTDEFVSSNIGFFNHAVARLSLSLIHI